MTRISRSRGSSPRRARSSGSGMLTAPGTCLHGQLFRIAHIEEEVVLSGIPVAQRHVAAQDIGRDHPREVDGRLGAAKLGRVAQLGFFQVVDRRAQLDRHGNGIDPLVHARPGRRPALREDVRPICGR